MNYLQTNILHIQHINMENIQKLVGVLEIGESLSEAMGVKLNGYAQDLLVSLPAEAEEFSSIMPAPSDDGADNDEKLFCFLTVADTLSPAMRTKLNEHVTILLDKLTPEVGNFLHTFDPEECEDEVLTALIEACPKALLHKKDGKTPIEQAATRSQAVLEYIPLFAQVAKRHKVFDESLRGGIVGDSDQDLNVLISLAKGTYDEETCLSVFESLKECNLMKKDDIKKYSLLDLSKEKKTVHDFLTKWSETAELKDCGGDLNVAPVENDDKKRKREDNGDEDAVRESKVDES